MNYLGTFGPVSWSRLAHAVTSRRSWLIALLVILASGALMGLAGSSDSSSQSPIALPDTAESARVAALIKEFPGGDSAPAILVVTRTDGAPLSPEDRAAAEAASQRIKGSPPAVSEDGQAALSAVPVDSKLSGFALTDTVTSMREAAADGLPSSLQTQLTGGPAFGADIANAFSGANFTLLAVTAAVVALLLILTYRSPILWLVPLLVIAIADRVGAVIGERVTTAAGLIADGSTAGITSVLVFGAGTNYALLLISRYREELRHTREHRVALATAVRTAGPAIVASNATVVLALLTLLFAAAPSTRSLGLQAATGLVVAAVFAIFVLPPLLAVCGTRLFWPFIPNPDDESSQDTVETGVWHRIAAGVAARPAVVLTASIAALLVLASGLLGVNTGLTQVEQFRVKAESVTGFEVLSEHFPSGMTDPTTVVGSTEAAAAIQRAIDVTDGVVSAAPRGEHEGLTQWSVIINADPASDEAFDTITALRTAVHDADPDAMVGGADATALDVRDSASRDQLIIIPAILAVVLAVLFVLLRSVLAPVLLVGVTVLSAVAALGLGGWVSLHVFGFPALDTSTPLYAFLFLVALGVDYTIFLVTRAREETMTYGTRTGIVRAVSATGAVITSAGIVLAAVFCVLGVLPLIVLTQVGIIVGLGILLDTFLVRTVVIPALFTLIGPRVWWPAHFDADDRAEADQAPGHTPRQAAAPRRDT
ncbi:membrane protein [Mycolicibacterium confluentis]|uniref:Membrane protein n=2 Tax=Mycolicibacterium confluentis TaxID=28047 RepID=A0A7I7Y1W2_9MYCO|nr:MMPL family transporter [Mycolicibacterium confluentis]BBZ35559.1 membrane protein [Mycolicibacterium confluentis]